jgi:hypothetical protein
MRRDLNSDRLKHVLHELGRRSRGPGRIYLTGGATSLLREWRNKTKGLDISFGPEPEGIFEAIRDVKEDLDINVELAAPSDFLPELPGWRERSEFVLRAGEIDVFHYDFASQALAKIERGHLRDRDDVRSMLAEGLVDPELLRKLFAQVRNDLVRYPAIDPDALEAKLDAVLAEDSK